MSVRLGQLLVEQGVLNEEQRDAILRRQRVTSRPFGLLAEEMFGVSPRAVESAWASQYARIAEWVDPAGERPTREALDTIEARQAWQFGVLPIRFDAEGLMLATTEDRLARALRFTGWRVAHAARFVMCDEDALTDAIARYYPMAGMSADSLRALRLASD